VRNAKRSPASRILQSCTTLLWRQDVSNATDALLRRNIEMPMVREAVTKFQTKGERGHLSPADFTAGSVRASLTIS
jgi:hypothetical protein